MSYRMDNIKKETKSNVQLKAIREAEHNSSDSDIDKSSSSDDNLHI